MIEWEVAARPHENEKVSGDGSIVVEIPGGVVIAVVDGLGHGRDAAAARDIALAVVESRATEPIPEIFQACHAAMRKTRGAALCIAAVIGDTIHWSCVGNVEGILIHGARRRYVLPQGGVVGFQLPPRLRVQKDALTHGDLIVFFTDGVRRPSFEGFPAGISPSQIAKHTLSEYGIPADDALVWVAKYSGEAQ